MVSICYNILFNVFTCFFSGYLKNIHRIEDMIVVTHCPETPKLKTFSFKSKLNTDCFSV